MVSFLFTNPITKLLLFYAKRIVALLFLVRLAIALYSTLVAFPNFDLPVCYVSPPRWPVATPPAEPPGPILDGVPVSFEWVVNTPQAYEWYFVNQVNIPGAITNAATIEKLSELNGYLLYLSLDVWGEIRVDYTRVIQQDLDRTPPIFLDQKLDFYVQTHRAQWYRYLRTGRWN
ncbi:hypothetical protein ABFX02_12G041200 [Erythranthe guttata]